MEKMGNGINVVKRYKGSVLRQMRPGDTMHSLVTTVNNIVLHV